MSERHIERIEVFRLRLKLRRPWRTAYGTETVVETLFGRIGAGPDEAWYESCPLRFPDYAADCAASAFAVTTEHLAPLLLGLEPEMVSSRLASVRGNSFSRDLLIGLASSLSPQPNPTHSPIAGVTVSLADPDLLATARRYRHRRLRAKFTSADDLSQLRSLREALPDTAVAIDCNAAFDLKRDMPLLRQLDQLDLAFIEQPLHHRDLVRHAELQAQLSTPLGLDESLTCPQDAETAIALGAARVFNLKPGRLGGPLVLQEILNTARLAGIDCFIGGMLESPLGTLQNARLATLPGITMPSDLPNPQQRYQELPVNFTIAHDDDGRVIMPASATVNPGALPPFLVDSAVITR